MLHYTDLLDKDLVRVSVVVFSEQIHLLFGHLPRPLHAQVVENFDHFLGHEQLLV